MVPQLVSFEDISDSNNGNMGSLSVGYNTFTAYIKGLTLYSRTPLLVLQRSLLKLSESG